MLRYQTDPKPEIFRIEELVIRVRQGDIKLPKFQRPFIWNRNDVLKLWDSIYNGYPVGSFLLWFTELKLARETRIGDLEISPRPDKYPTNYLLDGQQRLSTLCGALFWNGEDSNSMWNISFDLEKETFIFPKDEIKVHYFPLNKLLETPNFLRQCKYFENAPKSTEYFEKATALLNSVKDYKIAAVTIGEMPLNEVAPIFERINSTGRRLTIYDLMRAATWTGDFDLNETVDVIRRSLGRKGFDGVPETQILRSIGAGSGGGINKADIESLRHRDSHELKTAAEKAVRAYDLAVDFLTNEVPISSYSYLPYGLQLTYLVEFFRINPTPSPVQQRELLHWFWRTSVSRYFLSSNTTQNTTDLMLMRLFANGKTPELGMEKPFNEASFVTESFALNKALSKCFALLLASKSPRRLFDGGVINTYQALAVVNRHEYHHIFPQAYLKSSGLKQREIDQHANICLLNKGTNTTISDQRPSVYFREIANRLGDDLQDVLDSNFINKEAFEAGLRDDYEGFIEHRSYYLVREAHKLSGPLLTTNEVQDYFIEKTGQEALGLEYFDRGFDSNFEDPSEDD